MGRIACHTTQKRKRTRNSTILPPGSLDPSGGPDDGQPTRGRTGAVGSRERLPTTADSAYGRRTGVRLRRATAASQQDDERHEQRSHSMMVRDLRITSATHIDRPV